MCNANLFKMDSRGISSEVAYFILQSEKLRSLNWKPLLKDMSTKEQLKLLHVLQNMPDAELKWYTETYPGRLIMKIYLD